MSVLAVVQSQMPTACAGEQFFNWDIAIAAFFGNAGNVTQLLKAIGCCLFGLCCP